MENFKLTPSQQKCYDAVINTDSNYLVTGKPGVGKSVFINAIVNQQTKKQFCICAPTGLAATNVDGRTLHSIFKIPVSEGVIEKDFNSFTGDEKTIAFLTYRLKHLIIDEISMVRADTLDYIDRMLKHLKHNDRPFGGVQVIIVGDFYQLPPVINTIDKRKLTSLGYASEFAFDSDAYLNGDFKTLELTEVLRQKGDNKFIDLLHAVRSGNVKLTHLQLLNKQLNQTDKFRVTLCPINRLADQINLARLDEIEGNATQYTAAVMGTWPAYPIDEQVKLKVGAQVMVRMNGSDRPPKAGPDFVSVVVNGTIGVVREILEDKTVIIDTEKDKGVKIFIRRWERKLKKRNEEGKWEEIVLASFEQIPLTLAWAMSIHKCQGQTFSAINIQPERIFAAGQMYVALSRCKSLKGIGFSSLVQPKHIYANKRVVKFYGD